MASPLPPALVLTAGRGVRLAPLTDVRAKPAVPVAAVPLVVRVLRWLASQGVPFVVLNLHHKPDTLTRIVGRGDGVGLPVRYSWESTLLGSAGGPRHAAPLLGSRFLIVNGDTLVDLDLQELLQGHETSGAEVTMAVTDNPDPARYGGVQADETGRVTRFTPPGQPSLHFVGVQVAESRVFEPLSDGSPASTVGELYEAVLMDPARTIGTHYTTGRFRDVGTPSDYLETSLAVAAAEGSPERLVSERSRVHPTATLCRTIVWDDVVIGAGCRLRECIVADGVRLAPNTTCERVMIVTTDDGPLWVSLDAH